MMREEKNHSPFACNKRGQFVQIAFGIVVIFAAAVLFIFLQSVSNDINTGIQGDEEISTEAKASMSQTTGAQSSVFDSGLGIVLGGLFLVCLGLAYNSQGSPFLLVVALFIVVALGLAAMILGNAWEEFASEESTSAQYPIANFILTHYLAVFLVMFFCTLIVGMSRGGGF